MKGAQDAKGGSQDRVESKGIIAGDATENGLRGTMPQMMGQPEVFWEPANSRRYHSRQNEIEIDPRKVFRERT